MDDPAASGRDRRDDVHRDETCRRPTPPTEPAAGGPAASGSGDGGGSRPQRSPCDAVEEALLQAILDHARDLGRIALKVVGNLDAAEEAVAEAYYRAWRDRRAIRRSPLAWLKRTVFRVALDLRTASAAILAAPLEEALAVPSQAPGPDRIAEIREERRRVRDAVDGLPSPYAEAVRMRELDGWKAVPAAAALGIPVRQLKYFVARGKVLLAPVLEDLMPRMNGR